jgi:hypothetical protein
VTVAVREQEGVAGFEFDFLRNADAHAVLAPTLEGFSPTREMPESPRLRNKAGNWLSKDHAAHRYRWQAPAPEDLLLFLPIRARG